MCYPGHGHVLLSVKATTIHVTGKKPLTVKSVTAIPTGHRVPGKLSVILGVNDFNSYLQTYAACIRQRMRES